MKPITSVVQLFEKDEVTTSSSFEIPSRNKGKAKAKQDSNILALPVEAWTRGLTNPPNTAQLWLVVNGDKNLQIIEGSPPGKLRQTVRLHEIVDIEVCISLFS